MFEVFFVEYVYLYIASHPGGHNQNVDFLHQSKEFNVYLPKQIVEYFLIIDTINFEMSRNIESSLRSLSTL